MSHVLDLASFFTGCRWVGVVYVEDDEECSHQGDDMVVQRNNSIKTEEDL